MSYEMGQARRANDVAVATAYGFEGISKDKLAIAVELLVFIAEL